MGKRNCSNLIYQFALARELQRSVFTLSLQIANLYDSHSQVPHSADEISAAAQTRCCSRFPDAFASRLFAAGNLSGIEFASGGDFSPAVRSQITQFDIGNATPDVSTLRSVFGSLRLDDRIFLHSAGYFGALGSAGRTGGGDSQRSRRDEVFARAFGVEVAIKSRSSFCLPRPHCPGEKCRGAAQGLETVQFWPGQRVGDRRRRA